MLWANPLQYGPVILLCQSEKQKTVEMNSVATEFVVTRAALKLPIRKVTGSYLSVENNYPQ
jgi:hypothetical protein